MAELKFSGCRLEVQLEAQSPMIHFQYMQPGATIRASEVKPKLDHFILRRLQKETGLDIGDLKKSSKYRSIFIDGENNVLDYRMKLDASAAPYSVVAVGELRTKEYDIYYGNSGKKTEEEKLKGVFSNPKLTILCFNRTLRMLIERWTEAFFMVTNFGTMQNKGFGSFAPAGIWGADGRLGMSEQKQLAEYLKEETGAAHCYCMRFKEVPDDLQEKNEYCKKMFAEIKSFYSIMKSGQNFKGYARSYLYQYMHGRDNNNNAGAVSIDNEKAWMKQNGIAPIVAKPQNVKRTDLKDENPR